MPASDKKVYILIRYYPMINRHTSKQSRLECTPITSMQYGMGQIHT